MSRSSFMHYVNVSQFQQLRSVDFNSPQFPRQHAEIEKHCIMQENIGLLQIFVEALHFTEGRANPSLASFACTNTYDSSQKLLSICLFQFLKVSPGEVMMKHELHQLFTSIRHSAVLVHCRGPQRGELKLLQTGLVLFNRTAFSVM